jgi:poly(3-hydroxybutyrate) depolymerase
MYRFITLCILLSAGLTAKTQTSIISPGEISEQTSKPIANSVVEAVSQGIKNATVESGFNSITQNVVSVLPLLEPQSTVTVSGDQKQSLTPDSGTGSDKNTPCPSLGCGKNLSDLKSGTYTIESAGLSRKYIIDIPENYDKNTPYRLIFGMHMMGGNMNTVVNMNYYGLKTYADKENVPVIFVAPEGNSDRTPWRVNDDKDHVFFADMLKLFKEKLCVDTSRVFCCGFSYGAMVTYSLSLDFQKDLRAVACYAPANWNIYLPVNTHEPIAFYSTTGTDDFLCKYVNSDEKKEGGKYCVLKHLEDNGCTIPETIPTATGSTHISTEFQGCKDGYPVIFGSFKGSHSMNEKDPGSDINWIAKETWDFFMRF